MFRLIQVASPVHHDNGPVTSHLDAYLAAYRRKRAKLQRQALHGSDTIRAA
jgi:hypothetical protein